MPAALGGLGCGERIPWLALAAGHPRARVVPPARCPGRGRRRLLRDPGRRARSAAPSGLSEGGGARPRRVRPRQPPRRRRPTGTCRASAARAAATTSHAGATPASAEIVCGPVGFRAVPGALLELRNVEARYGPVAALHGVSLTVGEGEIVAVLGANGAGKTTTLRAVSGTVRRSGEILLDGAPIGRTPEATARQKVAHVPEGRGTFVELSVEDNLRLGAYTRRDGGRRRRPRPRPRLVPAPARAAPAAGGHALRRRAADARPRPRADAPAAAAAPRRALARARAARRRASSSRIVRRLNEEEGLAVLVVEQNATVALDRGPARVRARGRPRRGRGPERRAARARRGPHGATWATDGRVPAAGRLRTRLRRDLRQPRARPRPDLPHHGRRQLRPGRDGDVHHVRRLER